MNPPKRTTSRRLPLVVAAGVCVLVGAGVALYWVLFPPAGPSGPGDDDPGIKERPRVQVPAVHFTDVTEKAGVKFQHTNGAFGKKLLPETMGSGVVVLDYDGDGKPDLLFINSCWWPGYEKKGEKPPTMALYRNKGDGTFEDVTRAAGLELTFYGQGATVGDYDNDGWPDVFITAVGGNHLFHNEAKPGGGRHFVEVTQQAGVGGPGGWPATLQGDFLSWKEPLTWSTSASFLDYDGDGLLDLFVCNYVAWSPDTDLALGAKLAGSGVRAYAPPTQFEGAQCFLYRNLGGGKFEDVSARAGVQVTKRDQVLQRDVAVGKSLGVVVCDVDEDGWPDVFVANDTVPNFFFHNEHGTFKEMGGEAGVALALGQARGAMGIDWGEYRPGTYGLVLANFQDEPDTFLRPNRKRGLVFTDVATAEGLTGQSKKWLKFGAFFFDYDLDGRPDLLTVNGHLEPEIGRVRQVAYEQPAQLFWNSGRGKGGCFAEVTAADAGSDLFKPLVGRGSAYLDFDGDGSPDVVLTGNGGPARLLHNDGGTGHHWLRLKLEGDGVRSNKSAIGARVELKAGTETYHREVCAARGYLSQSEMVLTFGLGKTDKVDSLTIRWPGNPDKVGPAQVIEKPKVDQELTVRQGSQATQ
jgi:hypothetical protein